MRHRRSLVGVGAQSPTNPARGKNKAAAQQPKRGKMPPPLMLPLLLMLMKMLERASPERLCVLTKRETPGAAGRFRRVHSNQEQVVDVAAAVVVFNSSPISRPRSIELTERENNGASESSKMFNLVNKSKFKFTSDADKSQRVVVAAAREPSARSNQPQPQK